MDRRPEAAAAIRFEDDPGRPGFGTVSVTGLDPRLLAALRDLALDAAAWERLFPVFTGENLPAGGSHPLILGEWSVEPAAIRFTPRFPLATGLRCTARFEGPVLDGLTGVGRAATPVLEIGFSMPDPGIEPSTRVTAIHPSGEEVPENLLRLYVTFSAPMRDQPLEGMVRLFDEEGVEHDGGGGVRGEARMDPGERRWTFTPDAPWQGGRYAIAVHPSIEDLAGNTPSRLFDEEGTDQRRAAEPADREPIQLTFSIQPPRGSAVSVPRAAPPPDHGKGASLRSILGGRGGPGGATSRDGD